MRNERTDERTDERKGDKMPSFFRYLWKVTAALYLTDGKDDNSFFFHVIAPSLADAIEKATDWLTNGTDVDGSDISNYELRDISFVDYVVLG